MKRQIMTGLAVAASTVALTNQEALSQTPKDCAPTFYDETNESPASPELQQAIGKFAAQDITVKIRIIGNASTRGIQSEDDARTFLFQTLEACNLEDKDTLSMFVSTEPRVFRSLTTGKTKSIIPDSTFEDTEDAFVADLRDNTTPIQADITNQLDRLPATKTTEASSGSDTNWGAILGGSGVALLGLGLVARIKRARSLKKGYLQYRLTGNGVADLTDNAIAKASKLTAKAPEDAGDIRFDMSHARSESNLLQTRLRRLDRLYSQRRIQPWPRKFKPLSEKPIQKGYGTGKLRDEFHLHFSDASNEEILVATALPTARTAIKNLEISIENYKATAEKLPTHFETVELQLATCQAEVKKLQDQGWDISGLLKRPTYQFGKGMARITNLIQEKKVMEPDSLLKQTSTDIEELHTELSTLNRRRKSVDTTLSRDTNHNQSMAVANKAKSLHQEIKDRFHPNCLAELDESMHSLEYSIQRIESISERGKAQVGILTFESLEQSEGLYKSLLTEMSHVDTAYSEVYTRKSELQRLETSLPKTLQTLSEAKDMLIDFTLVDYASSLHADIQHEAKDLQIAIDRLTALDLSEKPDYLDISTQAKDLTSQLKDLAARARRQIPGTKSRELSRYKYTSSSSTYNTNLDSLYIYAILSGSMTQTSDGSYSDSGRSSSGSNTSSSGGSGGSYDTTPTISSGGSGGCGGGGGGNY